MNSKIKKYLFIYIAAFLAGILDFATASFFQDVLHVPLFFDTFFLMAVLFLYGPLPALFSYVVNVICGCIKLVILYGKNDFIYLFTLSAITIIVVTWLFIRKKENLKKGVNFTFIYILSASVCAALACSVVSGIISYFTFSLNVESGPFDKIIFAFSGDQMGVLSSCIIGRIPITVLDRIVTTFGGFGISLLFTRITKRVYGGGTRWLSSPTGVSKPHVHKSIENPHYQSISYSPLNPLIILFPKQKSKLYRFNYCLRSLV